MPTPEISIILPLFRNEAEIPELIKRLRHALPPGSFEIIGVDDASPDRSANRLTECAATAKISCIIVRHPKNRGQHQAIYSGLGAAQGEFTVVMDADLQDPPEAVPNLLKPLQSGQSEIVFGRRNGEFRDVWKELGSHFLKRAVLLVTGAKQHHRIGTFFALSRRARAEVLAAARIAPHLLPVLVSLPLSKVEVAYQRALNPNRVSGYTFASRFSLGFKALLLALRMRGAKWRTQG